MQKINETRTIVTNMGNRYSPNIKKNFLNSSISQEKNDL